MPKSIVIHDFAQLPYLLRLAAAQSSDPGGDETASDEHAAGTAHLADTADSADVAGAAQGRQWIPSSSRTGPAAPKEGDGQEPADLGALLAELDAAGVLLAELIRRDEEERTTALDELRRYDSLLAAREDAERVCLQAREIRGQAERLHQSAFGAEAREQAAGIVDVARRTEETATVVAVERRREAEQLAGRLDVQRLLAERARLEAEERARAQAAARARRLAEGLSDARSALAAGQVAEAMALLEQLGNEHPSHEQVEALRETAARRLAMARVSAVEEAIWAARRELRHCPAEAVARLEAVDVEGLPEPLIRDRFGEWARSCARWCRERGLYEPLRYAPYPGRGAVIARERPDGPLVVISAIGMDAQWRVGTEVAGRFILGAQPLR